MKILQIVNPVIPFPAKTVGGTERIVQYLIDELLLKGHDITLMAHNDSVVPKGVNFIPIGTFYDKKNTVKIIWKHLLTNSYDVIHNHGRLIYFLPKIWSKIKKVHTLHLAELNEKTFNRFFKLKPKNLIICPCAQWIEKKYANYPGKWQFVNNGIPKDLYQYIPMEDNQLDTITIIARMSAAKGITKAIELTKSKNKNLIIAGKIGDNQDEINWFNDHVLKHCDNCQIKYIGPINDEQKNTLLSSSLALLMLSQESDAFNLTMLEANASGCPVITYDRFFAKVFIKDGINGFKGSSDIDLANSIDKITSINRSLCRSNFELNYTSEIMANNYLKIYNS